MQLPKLSRSLATQAQAEAQRIDRPCEVQLAQVFLSRPSSQLVIEALYQGSSLQQAAVAASVPTDVARKVLAVLQKQQMVG